MDFLCGWTLHEIVWPSSTLTQRTMYDCDRHSRRQPRVAVGARKHLGSPLPLRCATHLGVNLELLDAGHVAWRWFWSGTGSTRRKEKPIGKCSDAAELHRPGHTSHSLENYKQYGKRPPRVVAPFCNRDVRQAGQQIEV